jgi:hypothetical protein
VVLDGANQNRTAGSRVEQRLDEKGGGRLAVGPGDPGGGELPLRMTEEAGRGLGQGASIGRPASYTSRWSKVGDESVTMPSAPALMAFSI